MAIVAGSATGFANTQLSGLQLVVRDAANNALPNQTVTFAVTAGGGSIQQTTATTDATGVLVVPSWLLGKSAVPQTLRATVASVTFDIQGTVRTQYDIEVRFFGPAMTTAQQALFTNAAARIRGVITGDVTSINTGSLDLQDCLNTPMTINETIDDLLVFASVADIDGPGKVLAVAGPCYVRSGGADSLTSIIGVMRFDSNDINNVSASVLQSVITHEMLHVVGFGAMWLEDGWKLVTGAGTATPRYTGAQGRQGCIEVGGTVSCATNVPVENDEGPGTADVHWEESAFDTELMTGFIEGGGAAMPFSLLTIRSLDDIGYTINAAAFDQYTKPFGATRANASIVRQGPWELVGTLPIYALDASGRQVRQLRSAAK